MAAALVVVVCSSAAFSRGRGGAGDDRRRAVRRHDAAPPASSTRRHVRARRRAADAAPRQAEPHRPSRQVPPTRRRDGQRGASSSGRSWVSGHGRQPQVLFEGMLQHGRRQDVHRRPSRSSSSSATPAPCSSYVNGDDLGLAGRHRARSSGSTLRPGRPAAHGRLTRRPRGRARLGRRLGCHAIAPPASHWSRSGCARNEVDSEELAGRLEADGWELVADAGRRRRRRWSTPAASSRRPRRTPIDTLLAAADLTDDGRPQAVVAVGCLAERYGAELAEALPEADAVLGFDDYADIGGAAATRCSPASAVPRTRPRDRRTLLPAHAGRAAGRRRPPDAAVAGPARGLRRAGPRLLRTPARRRPGRAAQAGLRLRPALHVLRDPVLPRRRSSRGRPTRSSPRRAGWPSRACASSSWSARTPPRTARTSATCGCWRRCCPSSPRSTASSGSGSPTCSPPRCGPALIEAIATTPGVAAVLRPVLPARQRARCCAGCAASATTDAFLELLEPVRALAPEAGVRSNVIVGFPGETEDDVGRARAVPGRGPARRRRRVRLLRRGRHRGGRRCDGKLDPDEVAARGSSASPRWSRS